MSVGLPPALETTEVRLESWKGNVTAGAAQMLDTLALSGGGSTSLEFSERVGLPRGNCSLGTYHLILNSNGMIERRGRNTRLSELL